MPTAATSGANPGIGHALAKKMTSETSGSMDLIKWGEGMEPGGGKGQIKRLASSEKMSRERLWRYRGHQVKRM
ncbi:MAG: hypothetical protein Q9188_003662 [Gyalolechia gomerana]